MLRELREEMAQASADLRFEDAAKLRDRISAIEKLDDREKRAKDGVQWQPEVTVFSGDPGAAGSSPCSALWA